MKQHGWIICAPDNSYFYMGYHFERRLFAYHLTHASILSTRQAARELADAIRTEDNKPVTVRKILIKIVTPRDKDYWNDK